MTSSKQAFGQFVTAKRQTIGLTQRQLAERLHVTESAVSKWERGVSYPDITLVGGLADALGVSEGELINAGDDEDTRRVEREARIYRRWHASLLWTTIIAYAATIAICLIVNLSVSHTLSWFWVVLAALGIAFSVTSLPLLPIRGVGWCVLGAGTASLFVLLCVVWLLYAPGAWTPIPFAAILFAEVLVFSPIWLRKIPLAWPGHRAVLALAIDSVALLLLILVVFGAIGRLDLWVSAAVPIALFVMILPWGIALILRYLPANAFLKWAFVVAFGGVFGFLLNPALRAFSGLSPVWRPVDFSSWTAATIPGNILVLALAATLLVAVALATTGVLRRSVTRTEARGVSPSH